MDLITIQKLLERCYDVGFKQFDTAPNYGMGFAEFSLGKVLGDKNDCLINTKIKLLAWVLTHLKLVIPQESLSVSLKKLYKKI